MPKANTNSHTIIEVKKLTKKFKNLVAVDNISFKVKQGEVFAFLGPNGAGKTTTIRMLTTLLRPTKGEISINGFDTKTNQDNVRKSFGIVFQDFSLDEELTAYENMQFHAVLYKIPVQLRKKRIRRLLRLVGLWDRKNDFVKIFSGGMRRRLEIARGLLHHPKIIFLDEPTLGLDAQTRNKIWQQIYKLNQKYQTTIFFTTHYLEEAEKMASRVAIIDQGKIITSGTVRQLKDKTNTKSLEDAYLKVTGKDIRDEDISNLDKMRIRKNRRHK